MHRGTGLESPAGVNLVRNVKYNKSFYRCIRSKRKTRKNVSLVLMGQRIWWQMMWKNTRYSMLSLPQDSMIHVKFLFYCSDF